MKPNRIVHSLAAVAYLHIAAALAADPPKPPAPAAAEKAVWDKMTQAGTPGDAHKKLEPLVGKFTVQSKSWMDPAKPPEQSTGTSERKWIMGGRYIEEHFNGTYGGQPFTGMGLQGYDNVTKKYFGTWMDSGSTSITMARGLMNGNTIQYQGLMSDPVSGKEVPYNMTTTIMGKDSHKLEMWGRGPGGGEMKWMELVYTRAK
ncbi:hypothetical protein GCM10027277_42660 [Pseudoduganella ginsengisoli]|nr:DUF1579 domain-containing protein [Pseudoduganella ginsengisoli]